jgi:hypothetical protein
MNIFTERFFLLFILGIFWLTLDADGQKIIYPHSVFWSKTEINQLDANNRFGLGIDFVYRRKSGLESGNMFDERLRESVRIWGHYQLSEYARLSISPIGYMYTHEYLGKPSDLLRSPYFEWRSTVQYFHHVKQWDGRLMHTWRYRYEFRWQEQPGEDDLRFFMRFRMRYRIRMLLNSQDFYQDKTAYIALSNEIGLNLGKNVLYNTFNQNRLYVGIGYRFLNTARVELRYVDRIRTRGATGIEFDNGRGMMVGLYLDAVTGLGKKGDFKVKYTD